ncbi:hypothetical protein [Algibacter sp. 2305UL17-15]|uniref:hypothetical protein n=1 Tax=Algibacter sp. 2305UL17-15 TaxID=3231268 RepID=UPI003457D2A9
MKKTIVVFTLFLSTFIMAQNTEKLPYYEIPKASETYTAGSVASRMVDGLGFRYFWATEGLRPEDLAYKPNESGRTSDDIMNHLLDLSNFILNSISEEKINSDKTDMTFEAKRKQTLLNFEKASNILNSTEDLSTFDTNKFPFWNIINGPIADALWHCGQVVMLRRASGNPFNSKVSVFNGTVKK